MWQVVVWWQGIIRSKVSDGGRKQRRRINIEEEAKVVAAVWGDRVCLACQHAVRSSKSSSPDQMKIDQHIKSQFSILKFTSWKKNQYKYFFFKFVQFLAAQAILDYNKFWRIGWIHPFLQIILVNFILFFNLSKCKIANAPGNQINSDSQTAVTTFAFSSVLILLLCGGRMILESGHTYHGVPKERQSYQMLFIENVNADVETQFFEVVLTLNVHCSCTILDPSVYVYPIFKCTVSP